MEKIKSFLLVTTVMIFSTLMLTGCIKEYEYEDIVEYVEDDLKIDNAKVHKEPIKRKDPQNYEDVYWVVDIEDDRGLQFYVVDDRGWGAESESNTLRDNYNETMLEYFYKEYDGLESFTLVDDEEEFMPGLRHNTLSAEYKTLEDLDQCFAELYEFKDYVEDHGYHRDYGLAYEILMDNPIRYDISDNIYHQVTDADIRGAVTSLNDDTIQSFKEQYLLTCLDYRFEDLLAQFSDEEIADALRYSYEQIGISRSGDEDGPYEYYDDLGPSIFGYGVSFGTLYRLLEREGFEVEGDVDHYTFTGTQGDVFEISYDFHDKNPNDPDSEGEDAYYYLMNGEQIWMQANFYNHFNKNEVKEMTGLVITTSRDDFTTKIE